MGREEEGVEGVLVDECFNEPVGEEDRLCWPSWDGNTRGGVGTWVL